MNSRRCWSATRSGSTSVWPWARSSWWRRWVSTMFTLPPLSEDGCDFHFIFFVVEAGEDGVQGQEHARPSASGPLHHRTTRSLLHWAVDRRLRLPESHQVSKHDRHKGIFILSALRMRTFTLRCSCVFQAARADQLAAGGHREAEEAAGEEETSLHGPDASTQPRTEQTKEQEQRPGEWSVRLQTKAELFPTVDVFFPWPSIHKDGN